LYVKCVVLVVVAVTEARISGRSMKMMPSSMRNTTKAITILVPAGILVLPEATLCRHLRSLGPVQSILQLLCSGSGEKEVLALCFVMLSRYFAKKALGILGPVLKVLYEPPAFLFSSWFTHFCVSFDNLQGHMVDRSNESSMNSQ